MVGLAATAVWVTEPPPRTTASADRIGGAVPPRTSAAARQSVEETVPAPRGAPICVTGPSQVRRQAGRKSLVERDAEDGHRPGRFALLRVGQAGSATGD